jgi:hypothetical protein
MVGAARNVDARGILDVHHLRRCSDLGDDAETNLITLCRECHQILHGHRAQVKPQPFSSDRFVSSSVSVGLSNAIR